MWFRPYCLESLRRNNFRLNCDVIPPPRKLGRVVFDRFEEEHVSCSERRYVLYPLTVSRGLEPLHFPLKMHGRLDCQFLVFKCLKLTSILSQFHS